MTTDHTSLTWLITGASRGLGRALAERALATGDRVIATARDRAAVADLQGAHPDGALAVALDVTAPAQADAAVAAALERFGGIDVLVNNAGYGYLAAIEEGEDDAVRALFETNVFGVVTMLKAALPSMRDRHTGHVVNVSSFGGLAAFAATGYYHATKFALEGLSESLATELEPLGIAVTIAEPGAMRTDWAGDSMRQSAVRLADYEPTAGQRREYTLGVSGRQPGDAAAVAAAIVDLVHAPEPPLRLLLGSDALRGFRARLPRRAAEVDAYESVTRSIDLDAA